VIAVQSADLNELKGAPAPLLINPACKEPSPKFVSDKLRFGQPMEVNFGLHALLGITEEDVRELSADGEGSLIDEAVRHDQEAAEAGATPQVDAYGLTDLEWVRYVCGQSVETRCHEEASKTWQPDLANVADEEVEEALNKRESELREKAKAAGIDAGRDSVELNHFYKLDICRKAGLSHGHVAALRLYTSPIGAKMNMAIHDHCDPTRPHPYPALVILLSEAIGKLRVAQAEVRNAAKSKAASLQAVYKKAKEGDDADAVTAALAEYKAAEAASKALECPSFWRGVHGLGQSEFRQRGGSELSFMSVSKERTQPQQHAEMLLMKHMSSGETKPVLKPPTSVPAADAQKSEPPKEEAASQDEAAPAAAIEGALAIDGALATDSAVEATATEGAPQQAEASAPAPAAASTEAAEAQAAGNKVRAELPLLMFKVMAGADYNAPADISFLSIDASQAEHLFGLGTFMEVGKIHSESTKIDEKVVQYKMAEVHPTLTVSRKTPKAEKTPGAVGAGVPSAKA